MRQYSDVLSALKQLPCKVSVCAAATTGEERREERGLWFSAAVLTLSIRKGLKLALSCCLKFLDKNFSVLCVAPVAYGGASAEDGFPVAGNWRRRPSCSAGFSVSLRLKSNLFNHRGAENTERKVEGGSPERRFYESP